jgi:hypothetical protein
MDAKETQFHHGDTESTEKDPILNLVFRLCELCVSVVKFLYYSRLFAVDLSNRRKSSPV